MIDIIEIIDIYCCVMVNTGSGGGSILIRYSDCCFSSVCTLSDVLHQLSCSKAERNAGYSTTQGIEQLLIKTTDSRYMDRYQLFSDTFKLPVQHSVRSARCQMG